MQTDKGDVLRLAGGHYVVFMVQIFNTETEKPWLQLPHSIYIPVFYGTRNHSLLGFQLLVCRESRGTRLIPDTKTCSRPTPTIWVHIYIPNLLIQLHISSPHADYFNYSTGFGLFMSRSLITEAEINSLSGFSTQLLSTISLNYTQNYCYCDEKEKLNMLAYWPNGQNHKNALSTHHIFTTTDNKSKKKKIINYRLFLWNCTEKKRI